MNIDNLKSMLISLLKNNETVKENTDGSDEDFDKSIFSNSQVSDDIEKTIGDIFMTCDKNGNGDIEADEVQLLSAGLSSITGLSGVSLSALIGEESDDDKLTSLETEFAQMQGSNSMQIDFTKEPTKEDIQNNDKVSDYSLLPSRRCCK